MKYSTSCTSTSGIEFPRPRQFRTGNHRRWCSARRRRRRRDRLSTTRSSRHKQIPNSFSRALQLLLLLLLCILYFGGKDEGLASSVKTPTRVITLETYVSKRPTSPFFSFLLFNGSFIPRQCITIPCATYARHIIYAQCCSTLLIICFWNYNYLKFAFE